MKAVQMTLDENLIRNVDRVSKKLHVSRSAFTREALHESLARYAVVQQEQRHRAGYEHHPVGADEFPVWESEQDWGDE